MVHKWARWLHNPFRLGGPHRFRAGGRIRSGPQAGKVATQPLPPWGTSPLQSGGQNQRWSTSGQGGYITPTAWVVPTASELGAESEVAGGYITLAAWGIPAASDRGGRIRSGPQAGRGAKARKFSCPQKRAELQRNLCFLGDTRRGGIDITKDRPDPAFSCVQKRAEMLRHPCIVGGP